MISEMTTAKMGLSIKNFDITVSPPYLFDDESEAVLELSLSISALVSRCWSSVAPLAF